MSFAVQLERKIIGKISKIARGEETAAAGLRSMLDRLKQMDEVAAESLQKKLASTVEKLNLQKA